MKKAKFVLIFSALCNSTLGESSLLSLDYAKANESSSTAIVSAVAHENSSNSLSEYDFVLDCFNGVRNNKEDDNRVADFDGISAMINRILGDEEQDLDDVFSMVSSINERQDLLLKYVNFLRENNQDEAIQRFVNVYIRFFETSSKEIIRSLSNYCLNSSSQAMIVTAIDLLNSVKTTLKEYSINKKDYEFKNPIIKTRWERLFA